MQDRVPTYPGRVILNPVTGQQNVFDMVRADAPTQAGTPLNKATFLTDGTASKIGMTGVSKTVNNALSILAERGKVEFGSYVGTGTYGSSSPNELFFSFDPDLVIVSGSSGHAIFFSGANTCFGITINGRISKQSVDFSGDYLSWYATASISDDTSYASDDDDQLNATGFTYNYIAIARGVPEE